LAVFNLLRKTFVATTNLLRSNCWMWFC